MSRIGRLPISVPADVKVVLDGANLSIEGKKGKLSLVCHSAMGVNFDADKKVILVTRPDDNRLNRALHGLTRTLINNMVTGVTAGFEKKLKIEGVGYQAKMDGKTIVLMLGYANPVRLTPPEGVTVEVPDPKEATTIIVRGSDKQKVGQFSAEVRAARKPEPYKGKGIRYFDEVVRRKEGKSFASGG